MNSSWYNEIDFDLHAEGDDGLDNVSVHVGPFAGERVVGVSVSPEFDLLIPEPGLLHGGLTIDRLDGVFPSSKLFVPATDGSIVQPHARAEALISTYITDSGLSFESLSAMLKEILLEKGGSNLDLNVWSVDLKNLVAYLRSDVDDDSKRSAIERCIFRSDSESRPCYMCDLGYVVESYDEITVHKGPMIGDGVCMTKFVSDRGDKSHPKYSGCHLPPRYDSGCVVWNLEEHVSSEIVPTRGFLGKVALTHAHGKGEHGHVRVFRSGDIKLDNGVISIKVSHAGYDLLRSLVKTVEAWVIRPNSGKGPVSLKTLALLPARYNDLLELDISANESDEQKGIIMGLYSLMLHYDLYKTFPAILKRKVATAKTAGMQLIHVLIDFVKSGFGLFFKEFNICYSTICAQYVHSDTITGYDEGDFVLSGHKSILNEFVTPVRLFRVVPSGSSDALRPSTHFLGRVIVSNSETSIEGVREGFIAHGHGQFIPDLKYHKSFGQLGLVQYVPDVFFGTVRSKLNFLRRMTPSQQQDDRRSRPVDQRHPKVVPPKSTSVLMSDSGVPLRRNVPQPVSGKTSIPVAKKSFRLGPDSVESGYSRSPARPQHLDAPPKNAPQSDRQQPPVRRKRSEVLAQRGWQ